MNLSHSDDNKEDGDAEAILCLHKYWIRADLMTLFWREEDQSSITHCYSKIFRSLENTDFYSIYKKRYIAVESSTAFDFWLAGVYSTLEGHKKLSLNYNKIDFYLKEIYKPLENYRKSVCHFEEDLGKKLKVQAVVHQQLPTIIEAHNTIGASLLKLVNKLRRPTLWHKKLLPSPTIRKVELYVNNENSEWKVFFIFLDYWVQTNFFRSHFLKIRLHDANNISLLTSYMDYWYATLYTLIEGYIKLGYTNKVIDSLLISTNLEGLKGYRHSVFHFQKLYFNFALQGSILATKHAATWVGSLHEAFNQFVMKKLSDPEVQHYIIKHLENIDHYYSTKSFVNNSIIL